MKKTFIIALALLLLFVVYYLFQKSNRRTPNLNTSGEKILSCEKLYEKILTESNELNRSCANDNDCLEIGGHACGECININADTAEYFKDIDKLRSEKCKTPAYSCALSIGCRCVNSKCESII